MTTAKTQNLVAGQASGTLTTADTFTETLVEQFITEADVTANTQRSYRNAVKSLCNFLTSRRVELSETALTDYREFLTNNRTARGAKLYFGVAKHFTKWLAYRGYICRNFAEFLKTPKVDLTVHVKDALTLSEATEILGTMKTDSEVEARNRCILAFLLTVGCRVSSLAKLKISDIERRQKVWTAQIFCKGHGSDKTTVIIPDETKKLIDQYLKIRSLRGRINHSEPLFTSLSRRHKKCTPSALTTQTISKICKKIFRSSNIDSPRITAHSARAAFATIAACDAHVDTETIAAAMSHASTATTKIYIKTARTLENVATRAVADLIFSNLKGVAA